MSRYILRPGFIISRNDGDRHWIGPPALRRLYRVPPDAEVIVDPPGRVPPLRYEPRPDDIICTPRHDGAYPVYVQDKPPYSSPL